MSCWVVLWGGNEGRLREGVEVVSIQIEWCSGIILVMLIFLTSLEYS